MIKQLEDRVAQNCYYICLAIGIIVIIVYIVFKINNISITAINPYDCFAYNMFGLYCPGCGGTRAVKYLLDGNILMSLKYHPAVLYTAVLLFFFMSSHTLKIITGGKVKTIGLRPIYFYILVGIIILQCIVKNMLILFADIYIL